MKLMKMTIIQFILLSCLALTIIGCKERNVDVEKSNSLRNDFPISTRAYPNSFISIRNANWEDCKKYLDVISKYSKEGKVLSGNEIISVYWMLGRIKAIDDWEIQNKNAIINYLTNLANEFFSKENTVRNKERYDRTEQFDHELLFPHWVIDVLCHIKAEATYNVIQTYLDRLSSEEHSNYISYARNTLIRQMGCFVRNEGSVEFYEKLKYNNLFSEIQQSKLEEYLFKSKVLSSPNQSIAWGYIFENIENNHQHYLFKGRNEWHLKINLIRLKFETVDISFLIKKYFDSKDNNLKTLILGGFIFNCEGLALLSDKNKQALLLDIQNEDLISIGRDIEAYGPQHFNYINRVKECINN